MPQLRLPHAMIVDVTEDTEAGRRTVILNCNEEYLFAMLDSVNPKNIIKYLDMRGIQHREPSVVNFYSKDCGAIANRNGRKYKRLEAEIERLRADIKELKH